jgi:magnesium-transporting ATPase (P-type)
MYPPLVAITVISMIKDGYEDYMHYKSDKEENEKLVTVVKKGGGSKKEKWEDLMVGQLIRINEDE